MAKARRPPKPQESTSARHATAQQRGSPTEYVNLWSNTDGPRDRFETLKGYLERTVRPLLGLKTIQVLVLREALDYLVLRTEDTREINDVVTPSLRPGQPELRRVAFLGGKQKAVESREFERLLRAASDETGFDQLAWQDRKECFLKGNLCLRCPRCGLFGATSTESGKGQKPNIKHRIEYSTAFSLLPYEEVVDEVTFNAIDDARQITDRALGSRPCVRPGTLFASVVTFRCVTPHEFLLALKVLLSARSYGAESRTQGDVRNHVIGIVAGWEEVLTPLELTLELEKNLAAVASEASRAAAVTSAVAAYFPLSAYPEKVMLLGAGRIGAEAVGSGPSGAVNALAPTAHPAGLTVNEGLGELLDAARRFHFSKEFLERAYEDVARLRSEQGDAGETGTLRETETQAGEVPAGSED